MTKIRNGTVVDIYDHGGILHGVVAEYHRGRLSELEYYPIDLMLDDQLYELLFAGSAYLPNIDSVEPVLIDDTECPICTSIITNQGVECQIVNPKYTRIVNLIKHYT